MKLFPSIPPVEIVEWQNRPGIRAETHYNLRDDMHTMQNVHRQDSGFGDDKNVQDMGNFYGAFTWSFSLET